MAKAYDPNDPSTWNDEDPAAATDPDPAFGTPGGDPFAQPGDLNPDMPALSPAAPPAPAPTPAATGPTPWDIAHTPNGAGTPLPENSGTGKVVKNWNDPSQWINDVTGEHSSAPQRPKPPTPATPTFSTPGAPGQSPFNSALRDFMLKQLGELSQPIDASSSTIAPALGAFNTQSQRDEQAAKDQLAEAFYAGGGGGGGMLHSGAFDTAVAGNRERMAGARSNFSGNLVYNASQARRQQLQGLLNSAVTAGDADQANELQRYIGELDASLRDKGLNQQQSQFGDSLGLNYSTLEAQMNRQQVLAALGLG